MHRFPAELFAEVIGVSLIGEHENLVPLAPPDYRVPVPRERKHAIFAKSPELVEVLAGAIILGKRHPMWIVVARTPEYPTIDAHQR
jgi:hypothetical protein